MSSAIESVLRTELNVSGGRFDKTAVAMGAFVREASMSSSMLAARCSWRLNAETMRGAHSCIAAAARPGPVPAVSCSAAARDVCARKVSLW